jgi:hypothetical protein
VKKDGAEGFDRRVVLTHALRQRGGERRLCG